METVDPTVTWNRQPESISRQYIPTDLRSIRYSRKFIDNFNADPIHAFFDLRNRHLEFREMRTFASYLFFANGIYPLAVTKLVFHPIFPHDPKGFLIYYFSSIILDFADIVEAACICFSRIAFPDNMQKTILIISAFTNAFKFTNSSCTFTKEDTFKLAMSIFIVSGCSTDCQPYSRDNYEKLLEGTELTDDEKGYVFRRLMKMLSPLYFTFVSFSSSPNYAKSGFLVKQGGFIKTAKEVFCILIDGVMSIYSEKSKKEILSQFDTKGTFSSVLPNTNKNDRLKFKLVMKNGGVIPEKITKNGTIHKKNHSEYIFYAITNEETLNWINILNMTSYWREVADHRCES